MGAKIGSRLAGAVIMVVAFMAFWAIPAVGAATLTVNVVDDLDDGTCDVAHCSLREAINAANAGGGLDTIEFDLPGPLPASIQPVAALPVITDPVVIDATTQPGYADMPVVELDGSFAGAGTHGLEVFGGSSTIRGLAVHSFAESGIVLRTGGGNVVEGNHLGLDSTGLGAPGNGTDGVAIISSTGNVIGGFAPGTGNVISGNANNGVFIANFNSTANRVEGNLIGTSALGDTALGNLRGILISATTGETSYASDNIIGGTAAGVGNVISGNLQSGIEIFRGDRNRVESNSIGTTADGTSPLGNGGDGVLIDEASDNVVGGTDPAASNLISGNLINGVEIIADTEDAERNLVQGNFIGTDPTGSTAIPNEDSGVVIHTRNAASAGVLERNQVGGSDGDDGAVDGVIAAGNVISGNIEHGVVISGATASVNRVDGNYIGTNAAGDAALGNGSNGVLITGHIGGNPGASNNRVGFTEAGNVLSGNGRDGVQIGFGSEANQIQLNTVGLNAVGDAALGNARHGVSIFDSDRTRVEDNTISGNLDSGVSISSGAAAGDPSFNEILDNRIGTDVSGLTAIGNIQAGVRVVDGSNNEIGSTFAGPNGNVISGNAVGVELIDGGSNRVQANFIGLDATGLTTMGNGIGVRITGSSVANVVGGVDPDAGNLISGNLGDGIRLEGAGVTFSRIERNRIGPDVAGGALGNGDRGIYITDAVNNTIGDDTDTDLGNEIAYNGAALGKQGHGVVVESGTGNAINRNSIHSNHGRGIDLGNDSFDTNDIEVVDGFVNFDGDDGANTLLNHPVVVRVEFDGTTKVVDFWFRSAANTDYLFEFFTNTEPDPSGFGEGEEWLTSVTLTTDAFGFANPFVTTPRTNTFISATATDPNGNTSEFSMVDTDADAIGDGWELFGIDYDEDGTIDLDLPAKGTDPNQKDVFVEIDAMVGLAPDPEALEMVEIGRPFHTDGFLHAPNHLVHNPNGLDGIVAHLELGGDLGIPRDPWTEVVRKWPVGFDLTKNGSPGGDHRDGTFGTPSERGSANWAAIREARRLIYHYAIFADRYGTTSGGLGDVNGPDFFAALGPWAGEGTDREGGTTEAQAGVLMHELGHNLFLRHGGGDSVEVSPYDPNRGDKTNYKPNYHSVMNYIWGFPRPGFAASWELDYSREDFHVIDESAISESDGFGGHFGHKVPIGPMFEGESSKTWRFADESGPIDLDGDGLEDRTVARDVNFLADSTTDDNSIIDAGDATPGDVLQPKVDWNALVYYFRETPNFVSSSGAGIERETSDDADMNLDFMERFDSIGVGAGDFVFSHPYYEVDEGRVKGSLTTASPTYNRPEAEFEGSTDVDAGCAATNPASAVEGTAVFYDALPVISPSGGLFEAEVIEAGTTLEDTMFALFCDPFDPAQPTLNQVATDDDGGAESLSAFTAADGIVLAADTRYWLVVGTFGNGQTGDYEIDFGGDWRVDGGGARVRVLRQAGIDGAVTIDYTATAGTATPGDDFEAVSGTLTFGEGEYVATFAVPIFDDGVAEGPETINVALTNPTGGAGLGDRSTAVVEIADGEATTFVVTNTNNSGPGSLRDAITNANNRAGLDVITFAIGGIGVQTISLTSQLPDVTDPVIIDGYTQPGSSPNTLAEGSNAVLLVELDGGASNIDAFHLTGGGATVRGLVINGFRNAFFTNSAGNHIEGNFLGTDPTGLVAVGNTRGVFMNANASGNVVGGPDPTQRNLIAASTSGAVAIGSAADSTIQGNLIGVGSDGVTPMGNARGVTSSSAALNLIGGTAPGEGNVIAYTGGTATLGNAAIESEPVVGLGGLLTIRGNSIFGSRGLGISHGDRFLTYNDAGDLDGVQNFPILESARSLGGSLTVTGRLASGPDETFEIDLYSSASAHPTGYGEGESYLGFAVVTTDAAGHGAFDVTLPVVVPDGHVITATATSADGRTSEFSARIGVGEVLTTPFVVNVTDVVDDGTCDALHCSLPEAIHAANNHAGSDEIHFGIPGPGVHTIHAGDIDRDLFGLPVITDPVTIDGYTQVGASPNTLPVGNDAVLLIELDGSLAEFGSRNGLQIRTDDTTIRGLVLNRFSGFPIVFSLGEVLGQLSSDPANAAAGGAVEGNFIGTNPAGTSARANSGGVMLGVGNRVGGPAPAQRNLLSGNEGNAVEVRGDGVIQGNYIGTNAAGASAVGNGRPFNSFGVIEVWGTGSVIGGPALGEGNVISGNLVTGIVLQDCNSNDCGPTGAIVQGNLIGTTADEASLLGNDFAGIIIEGDRNLIGGAGPGEGNVITGTRRGSGIVLKGEQNLIQGNLIGPMPDGSAPVPRGNNLSGLRVLRSSFQLFGGGNLLGGDGPGEANVIAYNGDTGISVGSTVGSPRENPLTILGNSIHSNGQLGIDLGPDGVDVNDIGDTDTGWNDHQNYPVITGAISTPTASLIRGTLDSAPETTYRVELFVGGTPDPSGFGEGETYLGALDVTTDPAGTATFVLPAPALSIADVTTATATDPEGNTSEFSSAEAVSAVPDLPPIAAHDEADTFVGLAVAVPVLDNDQDLDGVLVPASVLVVAPPGNGATSIDPVTGAVTYDPAAGFAGTDTFEYTVEDDSGNVSNRALATITVELPNQPPLTGPDDATTFEDVAVGIDVLADDSDPDGSLDPMTVTVVSPPASGTTAVDPLDGAITYTPFPDSNGADSFSYTVADDDAAVSGPTLVTVDVSPVNDAPSFLPGSDVTVAQDAGAQVVAAWATTMTPGPTDEAAQTLSFEIVSNSAPGLFSAGPEIDAVAGDLAFTPEGTGFGVSVVEVRLRDDGGTDDGGIDVSAIHTLTLTIEEAGRLPDLEVVSLEVRGFGTCAPGATVVTLAVEVRNGGPGPAVPPPGVEMLIVADGHGGWEAGVPLPDLGPGEVATVLVELPYLAADPPHMIGVAPHPFTAEVDPANLVEEANELNNSSETLDVGAPPCAAPVVEPTVVEVPEDGSVLIDITTSVVSNGAPLVLSDTSIFTPAGRGALVNHFDGSFTYTPAPEVNGPDGFQYLLCDEVGLCTVGDVVISIMPVNDAPSFTPGADVSVPGDGTAHTVAGWASDMSAGPPDEAGQALTFVIDSNSAPGSFGTGPQVDPVTGDLTFATAVGASGSAVIELRLLDDGGVTDGGVDSSPAHTLTVGFDQAGLRQTKEAVRAALVAELPSGDKDTDKRIDKAIERIDKSLDPKWWVSDDRLDPKHGRKVFDEERKAVKELMKIDEPSPAVSQAILDLTAIDEQLALLALADATATGGDIKHLEHAQRELDKVPKRIDKGEYDKAIGHYRKVWYEAQKVMR